MAGETTTFLVRVWLPDRPGALANVAARLGALKGDVRGLEIVERSSGLAVDELVVELPHEVDAETIYRELGQVDDVEVEDLRKLSDSAFDQQLDVLDAATTLVETSSPADLVRSLCECAARAVRAGWVCVLELTDNKLESTDNKEAHMLSSVGEAPNPQWVSAFVAGMPPVTSAQRFPELDAVWAPLTESGLALVVGRELSIRQKEQQRISGLARIADAWLQRMNGGLPAKKP